MSASQVRCGRQSRRPAEGIRSGTVKLAGRHPLTRRARLNSPCRPSGSAFDPAVVRLRQPGAFQDPCTAVSIDCSAARRHCIGRPPGVESMTRYTGTPTSLHAKAGIGVGPFSARIQERYGVSFSQFVGAEDRREIRLQPRGHVPMRWRATSVLDAGVFWRSCCSAGPDGGQDACEGRRGQPHALTQPSPIGVGEAVAGGRQDHRRQCQPHDLRLRLPARSLTEPGAEARRAFTAARIHGLTVTAGAGYSGRCWRSRSRLHLLRAAGAGGHGDRRYRR